MTDEKHKKWVEDHPQWVKTYKRLKHQNDRDRERRIRQIEELEEVSSNLEEQLKKINYMKGHLRKTL